MRHQIETDPAEVMNDHGWRPARGRGGWEYPAMSGTVHTSSSGAWQHKIDGAMVKFGQTAQSLEEYLQAQAEVRP